MPKQLKLTALFDDVPAGKTDTSIAAFESIKGAPRGRGQVRVFNHIESMGDRGATNEECENALGMRHATVSARANDLWRAGRIKDSGLRRKVSSGRTAKVWTVLTAG
jgi:hypothetical protein